MKHSASIRSRKQKAAAARRLRRPDRAAGRPHAAIVAAEPAPLTLARQNADLTAEGSPPPGKVGLDAPASPR
jgi:hypothetical protein